MPAGVRTVEDLAIPLADGRRLAARLWLPADGRPAPAILEYLPYRKRDGTAARDATTHPVFAAAGYACVRVDIAGTGESGGDFDDEYSERELADGEEAIAWIADRPWCDGAVGIVGISWGGFNGLQLAFRRPPALKAVVTVCSSVDRYRDDIHFVDGCLLTDNFAWGAQMSAWLAQPPDPALREDWRAAWLRRIDNLPFLAALWQRHPLRDGYWARGSVCEDWSAIRAAVLAIGGWADPYVNAPPALAANLDAPRKALLGPWEHKYPHIARIGPADFHGEVLRWFDRWLKGAPNGAEDLPALRAFVQEHDPPSPEYAARSGRWIGEAEWPSANVSELALYPSGAGLGRAPGAGERRVSTPLEVGGAAGCWCPGMRVGGEIAGDQAGDDALSVLFDTPPLEAPLELLGRAVLEVAFTADRPAAQLCARLCDAGPDGVSRRIAWRAVNLALGADGRTAAPLRPGRVQRARIALNHCAHRLRAGHRLRLALSTSYWPTVWPAPETAAVTLRLAECRLVLPERRAAVEIDPAAPGPPGPFPAHGAEALREPSHRAAERTGAGGAHIRETEDDFGLFRDPEHGLETGSRVVQRYAIRPGDPLSARHEVEWRREMRRDGRSLRVDCESEMTCDARVFALRRRLTAREDGAVILDRRWREDIPRGLL